MSCNRRECTELAVCELECCFKPFSLLDLCLESVICTDELLRPFFNLPFKILACLLDDTFCKFALCYINGRTDDHITWRKGCRDKELAYHTIPVCQEEFDVTDLRG